MKINKLIIEIVALKNCRISLLSLMFVRVIEELMKINMLIIEIVVLKNYGTNLISLTFMSVIEEFMKINRLIIEIVALTTPNGRASQDLSSKEELGFNFTSMF